MRSEQFSYITREITGRYFSFPSTQLPHENPSGFVKGAHFLPHRAGIPSQSHLAPERGWLGIKKNPGGSSEEGTIFAPPLSFC